MKTRFIDLENRKTVYTIDGEIDLDKIEEIIQKDKKLQNVVKKAGLCGIVAIENKALKDIIGIIEYIDGKVFDLEKGYFYIDSAEWNNRIDINHALSIMGYSTREYRNKNLKL